VLYGSSLRLERIVTSPTGLLLHCELPDHSTAAFPAWMASIEACSQFSDGLPQISLEALLDLHCFLQERLADPIVTAELTPKKQGSCRNEAINKKPSSTT
jgi:hypothetical protein